MPENKAQLQRADGGLSKRDEAMLGIAKQQLENQRLSFETEKSRIDAFVKHGAREIERDEKNHRETHKTKRTDSNWIGVIVLAIIILVGLVLYLSFSAGQYETAQSIFINFIVAIFSFLGGLGFGKRKSGGSNGE